LAFAFSQCRQQLRFSLLQGDNLRILGVVASPRIL
jgi:hypothetical protein